MIRYKVSGVLSCFLISHIFKEKHKVKRDIHSLNLLVFTKGSQVSYQLMEHRAALSLHTPLTPGVGSNLFCY